QRTARAAALPSDRAATRHSGGPRVPVALGRGVVDESSQRGVAARFRGRSLGLRGEGRAGCRTHGLQVVLATRQEGKGSADFDARRLEVTGKLAAVIRLEPLERP